ncbi:MAG: hypothetical protein QNK04_09800 [Myxococcota bacterium]|nr:hypothetical protein [Myxococcota bacterium]
MTAKFAGRTSRARQPRPSCRDAGRLLHGEIISFNEESELLIADLTQERPNCHLEVGYAMGVGRFTSLVLTAREDHNADRTTSPTRLDAFREELEKRVRRRQLMLGSPDSRRPR